jgi:ankyrin repeat protein
LLLASSGGYEKLALLLLDHDADPNARDGSGFTVLHHAAAGRNMLELVKALVAHKANVNVRLVTDPADGQPNGATPLFLAAQARNAGVMRILAANGADVQMATTETVFVEGNNGRRLRSVANTTPLMAAAGMGRYRNNYAEYTPQEEKSALEAVRAAVELGADINAANEWGWTSLHAAAYIGADSIIQLLAEKGAKMDVLDKFGQTPLSIASRVITAGLGDSFDARPRRIRESTVSLLLKAGATPVTASGVKAALIQ